MVSLSNHWNVWNGHQYSLAVEGLAGPTRSFGRKDCRR